jgi:hypothetical protein
MAFTIGADINIGFSFCLHGLGIPGLKHPFGPFEGDASVSSENKIGLSVIANTPTRTFQAHAPHT